MSETTTTQTTPVTDTSLTIQKVIPESVIAAATNVPAPKAVSYSPTSHARFSPSSFKYRARCKGWEKTEGGDMSAAEEGTMMHTASEIGERGKLNDEQWEQASKVIDYYAMIEKGSDAVYKEKRLAIAGVTYGTADRIVLHKGMTIAHLMDSKYGRKSQEPAKEHLQMIAYVVGIFEEWSTVEKVKVHILIPRRDEILTHVFTRSEYRRLRLMVRTIVAGAEEFLRTKNFALCTPSLEGCEYCGRMGGCEALQAWALPMVKKYEPLPLIQEVHASQITNPGPNAAAYYEAAKILEEMGKSARKHLLELGLKEGGFKDEKGDVLYEVAMKNGTRSMTNVFEMVKIFNEVGVSSDELLAFSKISIPDSIDFAAGKFAPKKGKTKWVAELETKLLEAGAISYGEKVLYLKKPKKKVENEAIEIETTTSNTQ